MRQIDIDYAQEALREFGIYAERLAEKSGGHHPPKLVLQADGSGQIESDRSDIPFSGLDALVSVLQRKNGSVKQGE